MSEWFPPAVGGSGNLLANVFSRMPDAAAVLTAARPEARDEQWPTLRIHRVPFGLGLGLMKPSSLAAHLRLARVVRRLAPPGSIVHCGRALPEGTIAMLAAWRGSPFICWTHGEELPVAASSRELRWLLRRVHAHAAALIANSENTARLLVELGNAPDKVHVVYPGVDAERFTPSARDQVLRSRLLKDADILILSVGRLQARKGHDLALRAIAALPRDTPRVRYVVIGDGPERERLHTLAETLGLGGRVDWLAAVADAELPVYYASADLFVHPNRVEGADFEGFGIVFLESAASGLPVIGGRSGGVPEAVADGRTGLLVSGTDVGELADVMASLARDTARRRELGSAGRMRALRDFSWKRAVDAVVMIEGNLGGGPREDRAHAYATAR